MQLNAGIDHVVYMGSQNIEPELYQPTTKDFLKTRQVQLWIETDTPGDLRLGKYFQDSGVLVYLPHSVQNLWDPHFWLSPSHMELLAEEIYSYLGLHDPKHKYNYTKNYVLLKSIISKTETDIKKQLGPIPGPLKRIVIVHPSLSLFCSEFKIKQIVISSEVGDPSLGHILAIRAAIIKDHIGTVFIEPQFSARIAEEVISGVPNTKLVSINTLDTAWPTMMYSISSSIAASLH